MDQLQKYFDDLYEAPGNPKETEEALRNVERRLGISNGHNPMQKAPIWHSALPAIAIAALAVVAAIIIPRHLSSPSQQKIITSSSAQWQELRVADGQSRELLLEDGSRLTLGGGSRITYPSKFEGKTREVFLDGQVKAEIAKNPDIPFIIKAGVLTVKVHGTSFNFKSYEGCSNAELHLLSGTVSLDIDNNREMNLEPGDLIQYDKNTGDISITKRTETSYGLYFNNITLEDIAFELERTFGVKIIPAKAELSKKRFLAWFTNSESLKQILASFNSEGEILRALDNNGIQ